MLQELTVFLADPRSFCAGVERAINMVEAALAAYGPPIYVRHSIVHNPMVIDDLTVRGAIFVETLEDVPSGARVLFSARGVAPSVRHEAQNGGLKSLDATCPLVLKVHREVVANGIQGRHTLIIGDRNHVEVVGIVGHAGKGTYTVIDPDRNYAVVTQTTLSVDDTTEIINLLRRRIPSLCEPTGKDICYATTNRQATVKIIAPHYDVLVVVGGQASVNSGKLVQVAKRAGCARSILVEQPQAFDLDLLKGCTTLGLTSGASTPEFAITMLIDHLRSKFSLLIKPISAVKEKVSFHALPVERLA